MNRLLISTMDGASAVYCNLVMAHELEFYPWHVPEGTLPE